MSLRKGLPVKLGATDANDTRYDFRNLVVCNTFGAPWSGVTSPVGEDLLVATATMNVQVKVFNAIAERDGGAVLLSNDGVTNVLLDNAPSSQSRLDVVWAKQNDSSNTVASADADDLPVFGVLKGEPDASPVRNPAGLPDGAVEIGTVLVPSTATATNSSGVVITTTCRFTCAPGGTVPFRTLSDMNAWSTGSDFGSPQLGQHAHVFDDSTTAYNADYVWDGSNWSGGWTSYTPVWTAAGGSTSLGAGALTGKYRIVGQDIIFRVYFKLGTGSSQGTGDWRFSLPATASPSTTRTPVLANIENSGVGFYVGAGFIDPSGTIVSHIAMNSGTGHIAGGTGGPTWQPNSVIALQGSYKRA